MPNAGAAVIAEEVANARLTQEALTRQELRREKTDEFKSKVEQNRTKLKEHFAEFKENCSKKADEIKGKIKDDIADIKKEWNN